MSTTKTKSVKKSNNTNNTKGVKSSNTRNTKGTKSTKIIESTKNIKSKKSLKDIVTSTKFLSIVFFSLLILVIILGVLCYKRISDEKSKKKSNMNIHIAKKEDTSEFDINAAALASVSEYIFRVSNYDDKLNDEEIPYTITISNKLDCVIEVTKDDDKKSLINTQEETKIEGVLSNKEKEDIYYHVKIVSKGKLDSRDLINVKIDS